jgi:Prophage tail length tape measure protein
MTLQIALVITGDATSAKKAAEETTRAVSDLARQTSNLSEAQRRASTAAAPAQELDQLRSKFVPLVGLQEKYRAELSEIARAHIVGAISAQEMNVAMQRSKTNFEQQAAAANGSGVSLGGMRMMFKALAREAALVGGPMAGMIGQVGTLTVGTGRLGVVMTAGTVGIAAIAAVVYKAAGAFTELESHQAKTAAALAQTKGASGQTVASLEQLARQLSASGTQGVQDIRGAQLELLKFKTVGSDAFGAVGRIARDVAATGFVDLKSATQTIAKALDDPTKATETLKEAGLTLSVEQQRLATDFYNTGQRAKATQVILKALSDQTAGADAQAANTLSASFGRTTNSLTLLFEEAGKGLFLKELFDAVNKKIETAKANIDAIVQETRRIGIGAGLITVPPSLADALGKRGTVQPPFNASEWNDFRATLAEAQKRVAGVKDALEEEARAAGLSSTAQRIWREQVAAGVLTEEQLKKGLLGTSDAARAVATAVNEIAAKGFMRQLTEQFITQGAALKAEAAVAGLAVGPAEAYRKEVEALAKAEAEGTVLSAARREELRRQAGAYGALAQAAAAAKIDSQITFDRNTIWLTDTDRQIAERLRDLYGNDITAALGSARAEQLRFIDGLKTLKDTSTDFAVDFAREFRQQIASGAKGWQAFEQAGLSALGRLADKLEEIAIKKLWSNAFGSFLGSFGGSDVLPGGAPLGQGGIGHAAGGGLIRGPGTTTSDSIPYWLSDQEFVVKAAAASKHRGLLEAINSGADLRRGFAQGGGVGSAPSIYLPGAATIALQPKINVYPVAGSTMDVKQDPDGTLHLFGRMIDERLRTFDKALPSRVAQIQRDPRGR